MSTTTTYYGSLVCADGLGNTTLAGSQKVCWRFTALHSGTLQTIRPALMFGQVGYSAGTGGKLRWDFYNTDVNGLPTGPIIGTGATNTPTANGLFPLLSFTTAPTLTAKQSYCIVWTNTDSAPASNYISMNHLYMSDASNQPVYSDWAAYYGGNPSWTFRPGYTPTLSCQYSDGFSHGIGYMEVWVSAPKAIGGAAQVRQIFTTPTLAPQRLTGLAVRLRKVSGSGALTLRLETSTGALLEAVSVPAASIGLAQQWVRFPLSYDPTFVSAQAYRFVLSAPAGTVYETFPIRDGSDGYGFAPGSVLNGGQAQYSTNGGASWVGWDMWGQSNRTEGDLQWYATTVLMQEVVPFASYVSHAFGPVSVPAQPGSTQLRVAFVSTDFDRLATLRFDIALERSLDNGLSWHAFGADRGVPGAARRLTIGEPIRPSTVLPWDGQAMLFRGTVTANLPFVWGLTVEPL